MESIKKYKAGQVLTYKPQNALVTVVHNSLGAGGTNADTAVVTVRTAGGLLMPVPVEVQDDYLSDAPHVKRPLWQRVTGRG